MKDILLAEYNTLKEEQRERIKHRDTLIYLTLGSVGTLYSFALVNGDKYFVLAIVPIVSFILGWVYIAHDTRISAIKHYIKENLSVQLKECLKSKESTNIFAWEGFHADNAKTRSRRKLMQLLVDILTFVFPSLVALFTITIKYDFYKVCIAVLLGVVLMIVLSIRFYKNYREEIG